MTDAPTPTEDAAPRTGRVRDPFRVVAGVVCVLEALVLVGFGAVTVWEASRGQVDDTTRSVMSAALMVVFAVLIGVVARAWFRGANWPSTPTVVWNLLLLPVAWSLHESDQTLLAVLVGVGALLGIVAAVGADTRDDERA